ncbi:hypothetical protein SUNI508_08901 [Seiridium unicorne]|uniref:Uncharacterized protein n=1 Tax=Seiridium unicorne TaxID=138068 RepID=A0ABR2USD2_9PEZI
MSSSLVWLPPRKYDSVRPLWQDEYIWSPLPVDNTIPLHQTSFIDITETDAQVARSTASTLRSRARTGSIKYVAGDGNSLDSVSDAQAHEESDSAQRHGVADGETYTHHLRATLKAKLIRPGTLDSKRLRSFHLPARVKSEPTSPTTDTWYPGASVQTKPPLQQVSAVDEAPLKPPGALGNDDIETGISIVPVIHEGNLAGHREGAPQAPTAPTAPRRQRRKRERRPEQGNEKVLRSSTGHKGRENKVIDQPRSDPPKRGTSLQTRHPKRMGLKLDLNLEIEVQLKVTLHGDLTLALLD